MGAQSDLRSRYLYLVSLLTLVMAILATAGLMRQGAALLYSPPVPAPLAPKDPVEGGDWQAWQSWQAAAERRSALLGLMGNAVLLAVALTLHRWHLARAGAGQPAAEHRAAEPRREMPDPPAPDDTFAR
ncbi:MAG: hypothetical protein ACOX2L_11675 [Anaerolineae bacterium]|jgi:hypothetical protein|nr:hypothetical protein [Chloroflexota bacterium]